MKITIKQLKGGECTVEVTPATKIIEIKNLVSQKLGIPIEQQKLLLLGRTLADDHNVETYPTIKDGSKLNLVVKKSEGLYEASLKYFKQRGMNDKIARNAATKLMNVVQEKFYKLSWDDLERLSKDCLLDEKGQKRRQVDIDQDSEELYNLP